MVLKLMGLDLVVMDFMPHLFELMTAMHIARQEKVMLVLCLVLNHVYSLHVG